MKEDNRIMGSGNHKAITPLEQGCPSGIAPHPPEFHKYMSGVFFLGGGGVAVDAKSTPS